LSAADGYGEVAASSHGDAARSESFDESLAARAARAARAELRGDRAGILGARALPDLPGMARETRRVPQHWSLLHVMERMEEGFRVLARLPAAARPRGYINSMPHYRYEQGDLNAQLETHELEALARLRNRTRIPPSPAEIARMEEALHWPAAFLCGAEFHHVARAVNLGSLWSAYDADVDGRLRRIGMTRRTFNARRLQGLRIITAELVRRRVAIR